MHSNQPPACSPDESSKNAFMIIVLPRWTSRPNGSQPDIGMDLSCVHALVDDERLGPLRTHSRSTSAPSQGGPASRKEPTPRDQGGSHNRRLNPHGPGVRMARFSLGVRANGRMSGGMARRGPCAARIVTGQNVRSIRLLDALPFMSPSGFTTNRLMCPGAFASRR